MRVSRLVSASILFLFALLPAQDQMKGIVLEEVLAIGDIEGALMYQKVGMTADNEGNIYLTDLKGDSIKKFNKIGEFVGKAGKCGNGPEEFNEPGIIKYHNDKLYVTESYRPGIHVFDKDLKFKFKIPLPFTVTDLNIISNNQFAVSTLARDRSEEGDFNFCIYSYDIAGNEKEKIIYATSKNFTMMNMVNFQIDRSKNFLVAYCWKDRIEKLDKNGNVLWAKSLLGNKVPRTKKIKGTKLTLEEYPVEMVYKAITLDAFGNLFILGGDLSENRSQDVYVLSSDGQFLVTFTLPESSSAITIDSKNYLYSRSEDGLRIRKYQMEYQYE